MIGTDLNLTLPELGDTLADIVAATRTCFSLIEDSIADRATPAGLNITSNLSIGGNHLTNVGGVVLTSGNAPVAAGSLYYNGTNFYLKDGTGVIQLTAAGAINLSAIGAIGGDYGTSTESFNYDLASTEFRAKASPTVWADIVVDDCVLMETGGGSDYVRLSAPANVTTSYTATLPAAPPASPVLLQMAATGTISATNTLADYINVLGVMETAERHIQIPASAALASGGHTYSVTGLWALGNDSVNKVIYPLVLDTFDRIKSVGLYVRKNSDNTNTITMELVKIGNTGTRTVIGSATNAGNATNEALMSISSLTETVALSTQYVIEVVQSDSTPSSADYLRNAYVVVDNVAV